MYKDIKVGELGNNGGNTDVLKKLYWVASKKESTEQMQTLIDNLDTKIRSPRF